MDVSLARGVVCEIAVWVAALSVTAAQSRHRSGDWHCGCEQEATAMVLYLERERQQKL